MLAFRARVASTRARPRSGLTFPRVRSREGAWAGPVSLLRYDFFHLRRELRKGIVYLDPLHQFTPHRVSLSPKTCIVGQTGLTLDNPSGIDSQLSHLHTCIDIFLDEETVALTNTIPIIHSDAITAMVKSSSLLMQ